MFKEQLEIYEKLWRDAAPALERGEQQTDPYLSDKAADLRRGVTVILRPSLSVRDKVIDYLERLAKVCPEQYYYRPEELHVTVHSIISGTEFWRREVHHLVACRAIISDVLNRQHSFKLGFRGVTASPSSVMIQGFPMCDGLTRIRDALREAFAQNGLGGMLDRRYRINTAHITAMRLRKPIADWIQLLSLLEEGRQTNFGETEVNSLQLIWGDWYASASLVRTLQEYRLSAQHDPGA
jgi:2'-5' RNA ligase